MFSRLKQAFVFLLIVFVILALFTVLTGSLETIAKANLFFIMVACVFFIVSILLWVFSWALLIKKREKLPFRGLFLLGISSVFASLTPLQFGTDAVRALMLKDVFKMPFSNSIAASMIVKGLKFFLIALLASWVLFIFLFSPGAENVLFKIALVSGFIAIILACVFFLLPLNKKIGLKIANFFKFFSKFWPGFFLLEKFFSNYSSYLEKTSKKILFAVLLISGFSIVFEFFSLFFSFEALNASLSLGSIAALFILINILERTPFLPRGIGIVEAVSFVFLSVFASSIGAEKIAAAIIIFDIARLVVPTIVSVVVYLVFFNAYKKKMAKHVAFGRQ